MISTSENKYAIGMDVGGSHLSSAVVDLSSGRIIGEVVDTPIDSKACATVILEAFEENIAGVSEYSEQVPLTGLGIAIPGPFDYLNGISMIAGVCKYDSVFGLDFVNTLFPRVSKYGIRSFRFINDASAFALGEYLGGAGKGKHKVMVLTLGTGVGSGFVEDGKMVEDGPSVPENGWVYNYPFEGGIADDAFSTRWFVKRFKELTGNTVKGAKEIADMWGKDPSSNRIFEEYGLRLAEFIAPLSGRFGAEEVILGGNIARAVPLFGEIVRTRLADLGCKAELNTSILWDKAAMIGAASLFV